MDWLSHEGWRPRLTEGFGHLNLQDHPFHYAIQLGFCENEVPQKSVVSRHLPHTRLRNVTINQGIWGRKELNRGCEECPTDPQWLIVDTRIGPNGSMRIMSWSGMIRNSLLDQMGTGHCSRDAIKAAMICRSCGIATMTGHGIPIWRCRVRIKSHGFLHAEVAK